VLARPVLLYDGNCAFCVRWVERIRHWDRERRVQLLASQRRHEMKGLPALTDEQLDRSMHLVLPDDRVLAGGAAIAEIMRIVPTFRPLRWGLRVPGAPRLMDRGYHWVAARRHRFGCERGVCGL